MINECGAFGGMRIWHTYVIHISTFIGEVKRPIFSPIDYNLWTG
jgi:hypothetical protein